MELEHSQASDGGGVCVWGGGVHTEVLLNSRSICDSEIRKTVWELELELRACLECTNSGFNPEPQPHVKLAWW